MKNNKKFGKISAKGYYIALILCAAAIGISGYVYYRNANNVDDPIQDPPDASVVSPTEDNVEVVGPNGDNNGDHKDPDSDQVVSTDPVEDEVLKTCKPISGETIADYAMDCLAYNATTRDWRTHDGIDIAAEAGATVCAAADGTVYNVYTDATMGTPVVIRHMDGYVTVYSSLGKDVSVSAGDTVTMGQAIGCVGNTALLETAIGDHLHFSVTCNGEAVDPEDFFELN